jgi:hypothetical protein
MEVIAVETAAAVPTTGGALRSAGRALTTPSPLTAATTTATPAILHEDQSGLVRLDNYVDRSRNAVRREWRNRRSHGAASERQSGREQQR